MIQAVTFLSPNVGGHDSPLKGSRELTIPKRSRSQNCQDHFSSKQKEKHLSHHPSEPNKKNIIQPTTFNPCDSTLVTFWSPKRWEVPTNHTSPLKGVHLSGQIIATSHDLTPNDGLVREIPLFQGNLGWWNIVIWPDISIPKKVTSRIANRYKPLVPKKDKKNPAFPQRNDGRVYRKNKGQRVDHFSKKSVDFHSHFRQFASCLGTWKWIDRWKTSKLVFPVLVQGKSGRLFRGVFWVRFREGNNSTGTSSFFQVTFWYPKWRSLSPWKGHLNPPKRSLGRTWMLKISFL